MAGAILVALILICVALILIGAILQKPHGWIIVVFSVIALLLIVLKGFPSL
jgi:hypothetical protein